jgi:hypothetical protein
MSRVFDEAGAARFLGGDKPLSVRTMQRWRQTGEGPEFFKMGGKLIRYSEDKLVAYRDGRRRTSTSEAAA